MSDHLYSETLQRILQAAESLAEGEESAPTSVHLLTALLEINSDASSLLAGRGLTLDRVGDLAHRLEEHGPEPPDVVDRVEERCQRLARSSEVSRAGPLHLMIALCGIDESHAYAILSDAGLDPASMRTLALALITSGPRRFRPQRSEVQELEPDTSVHSSELPKMPRVEPVLAMPPQSRLRKRMLALMDPRVTRGRQIEEVAPGPPGVTLDEEEYPTLVTLGRNLSEAAALDQLEPLVGRRKLVEQILDILGKRKANNPCLVGEPGVGKTAIVEGLAYLQAKQPDQVPFLEDKILVELNMGSLLSGTQLRGAFSERMASLRDEVEQSEGRIIVFLDEIHTLVGAGASGDGALDAVGELSTAMARGTFPCIGATTTDSYRRYIEEIPALQRRLQPVLVPEPAAAETLEILQGVMPAYAEHHEVTYQDEALDAAVRLSGRYIAERFLPDKAVSLLDLAGSRARRRRLKEVGRAEVAELVSEGTEIPVERLLMTDTERFLQMETFMSQRIVGHDGIIERVCQVIRRNYAGFSSNRPIGSFLFLGPTGVGKTETVKVLADFLFQNREALCRFDMSEFMEAHSVSRLIGSPPGYVGHEEGGQLTESVRRRPYQIVLLDEVEKAHRDVLQVLLQLLDDGRLTDGRGRTIDFSNSVVVMTSNLGSKHYDRKSGPIGFGQQSGDEWGQVNDQVLDTAKGAFPIELWNRIEQRLVFEPLTRQQVFDVACLLVRASSDRLAAEKKIQFSASDAALEFLIEHGGFDAALGARPMRTTIQRLVEGPLAELILLGRANPGDSLIADCVDGELVFDREEQAR